MQGSFCCLVNKICFRTESRQATILSFDPSLTSTKLCLFIAGFFFMLSKERKSASPGMSASATGLPRNAETRLFVVVDNSFNGC